MVLGAEGGGLKSVFPKHENTETLILDNKTPFSKIQGKAMSGLRRTLTFETGNKNKKKVDYFGVNTKYRHFPL